MNKGKTKPPSSIWLKVVKEGAKETNKQKRYQKGNKENMEEQWEWIEISQFDLILQLTQKQEIREKMAWCANYESYS